MPPYIKSALKRRRTPRKVSGSVFASTPASVAAPFPASLHFTPRVFSSLDEKGIARTTVTLHVGRGTFSPVDESMVTAGAMHPEPIAVSLARLLKPFPPPRLPAKP